MTLTDPSAALAEPLPATSPAWWRHAVIYQIYPRSWADGNGDGVGDLPGITSRLPYLRDLGVDAVWLSPFYVSPQADAGYDVADYRDIDPIFGTLADADTLLATAHDLGLKVIVDLVPNHSSDEHAWFQAALAAGPGSAERERYWFRDGRGPDGDLPPNNWLCVFGGQAWTRVKNADGTDGQWYLHLFDPKQPDFNWDNPQVRAEFEDVLRFWLDRGVDGFRVDVANALIKEAGLPDWDEPLHILGDADGLEHDHHRKKPPMWDQDGVHEVYLAWRRILNSYNPIDTAGYSGDNDRILCAEAWVDSPERLSRYVRDDEMHQAFNFAFLQAQWRAGDLRDAVTMSLAASDSVGAPTTWVLSNHDVVRHASRLGLPVGAKRPNGIGIGDPLPDAALGLRRARAATALMLALPGSSYLYQGEELGLPDSTDMPDEVRQDPTWARSGHTERGRDGCRVPMPWEADRPSYGFGPADQTWLPQPASYAGLAVDRQAGVPGTTLELYRALLAIRRAHGLGAGSLSLLPGYSQDVVALVNESAAGARVVVITNLGVEPVAVPGGALSLVSSGPLTPQGLVPTDTTVWLTA
ncbi:MAG: glycoside hydrolase family 13 protein [Dermatophilaceae bacterium]|nr:glycoside hydrolase family 13 protein [Dermatophilaceae bacterium]